MFKPCSAQTTAQRIGPLRAGPRTTIFQLLQISLPLSLGFFHFNNEGGQVDVNYNNEHMEFVRVFVDIIFTIWLINMIMNKHHAIMVGEKSVEVEGVDADDY